jgi:predicted MFS family arabinose efflux permease
MRALAGVAGGILSGAAPAYIGDYFPSEKRGWANGIVMTGIAMGQILGIPLGTVLAEYYGVAAPFMLFAIPMAASFLLVWTAVPQPPVLRETSLTIARTIRRYLIMLRTPHIAAAAGSYCMMFMGIAFYVIYLPTWLEETFDVTGKDIASLFVVGGLASVLIGPRAGKLSDRIGRKTLIIGACVGLSILMGATTLLLSSFWIAYPLFFLTMVMVAARMGPFQALLSEIVPAEQRGSMMSLSIAFGQLSMGLGSALSGFIYTRIGYTASSILGAAGMLVMGILVWFYIGETRPRTGREPQSGY